MDRLAHFLAQRDAETVRYVRGCLESIDPDALSVTWKVPGDFELLDSIIVAVKLICPKAAVCADDADVENVSVTFTWSAGDMPRNIRV